MGDSAVFVRRMLGMVIAGGLVVALAQSLAASPATAGEVTISGVTYTCTAKNSVIDQSLGGPQQMIVEARTTLPDTVTSGSTVPATTAQLKLTLPVALVNQLYGPMEVRRVKGEANSDVVVSGVAPGGQVVQTLNRPVNNLKVDDWVTLQQGSPVTIVANGNVDAIPVPQFSGNGLIYVTMPKTFLLRPLLDPPVIGRIGDTIGEGDMDCVRNEDTSAARVIGTIPVGAGCSQSDCALPSDAQSTTPTTAPTTGSGSGTDPRVIDPSAVPTSYNGVDDYDFGAVEGISVGADGTASTTSYTTTQLPATGSPLGVGLVVLFGALAVVRVGVAVRSRRRTSV